MSKPKHTVSQTHSGSGDNVAGNKNVTNNHNHIISSPKKGRIAGLYQDKGWISDDFNEPLNSEFFTET